MDAKEFIDKLSERYHSKIVYWQITRLLSDMKRELGIIPGTKEYRSITKEQFMEWLNNKLKNYDK